MLKNPTCMKRDASSAKIHGHFLPSHPCSLLGGFADYCQRTLVDESEMIRSQMETHNRSEMVAMYGMLCVIPPRNHNSTTRKL